MSGSEASPVTSRMFLSFAFMSLLHSPKGPKEIKYYNKSDTQATFSRTNVRLKNTVLITEFILMEMFH